MVKAEQSRMEADERGNFTYTAMGSISVRYAGTY